MALEKEALTHRIEDDLAARNRNWDKIETHLADFEYETESKTNVGIADGTFTLEKNKYWWKVFLHNVKLSNSANANKAYKIADLTNSYMYTVKTFPFVIYSQYSEVKGIGVGYIYYNSVSIVPNVDVLTTDTIRARAMTMVDE